jgi:diguanylate cyclase (GGDEF)-like protein
VKIFNNLLAHCVVVFVLVGGSPELRAAEALPAALHEVDSLARTRPTEALIALNRFAATSQGAALPVRRAVLTRLHRIQLDLGNKAGARAATNNLQELGQQQRDAVSLALVALNGVEDNIRDFQTDAGRATLAEAERSVDMKAYPGVAFEFRMAYGRLYLLKAEYERAIEQFQNGVEIARRTEDPVSARAQAFRNLAYAYLSLNDKSQAERMALKALDADLTLMPARLRALLYLTHANVLSQLKRFPEAEASFSHALETSRTSSVKLVESRVLNDWADLELRRGDFVTAERLSRQAEQVAELIGEKGAATAAGANIGFALGGQGKVAEGLPYIDKAVEKLRQQGNSQWLSALLAEKGQMLERQGFFKDALMVMHEEQKLEREQFTEQRSKAVALLQERFESQQNQRHIELLEQQNRLKDADIRNRQLLQVALGLVVMLMVAIGIMVIMLYRRARKSNVQLRLLNDQLAEHAVRDPLTGLHNRRSFVATMEARGTERARAARHDVQDGGEIFMVLDLDHFKTVNDTYGHDAGDMVLVEIAKRLQSVMRDDDTVLRWGGEEFVIHLPVCKAGQATTLARRILGIVNDTPLDIGVAKLRVSVSIGMIELPFVALDEGDFDWQHALRLADRALYLAKAGGRNRCSHLLRAKTFMPSADQLETGFDSAIASGNLVLHTVLPYGELTLAA